LEKEEQAKIALTVMNSWLRKRVLVFTGTLCLWDIDGRIAKLNCIDVNGRYSNYTGQVGSKS
jgi:hypothetical protein